MTPGNSRFPRELSLGASWNGPCIAGPRNVEVPRLIDRQRPVRSAPGTQRGGHHRGALPPLLAAAARTRGGEDRTGSFIERRARGIATVAASRYPDPVVVRMSDFETSTMTRTSTSSSVLRVIEQVARAESDASIPAATGVRTESRFA